MNRAVLAIVVILIAIGVMSGVARALYPTSLGVHAETMRERLWGDDADRFREVVAVESRFAAYPLWIFVHASVGALLMLAGALQFVKHVRNRHLDVHRWNGRVLIVIGSVVALTGMFFGVIIPAAGWREAVIISLVSALFLVSIANGALAIRRNDKRKHGEWMTRAAAIVLGVPTIRIVAAVADVLLTPRGWGLKDVFVLSLIVGWSMTSLTAEMWIVTRGIRARELRAQ